MNELLVLVGYPSGSAAALLGGVFRSTETGSARWFLFPMFTWEPLLLTWVV